MKKIIETDLVSIAHRILQMKDKSEVTKLLNETEKLYQKLILLKFYEDNKFRLDPSITEDRLFERADSTQDTEKRSFHEHIQNTSQQVDYMSADIVNELLEDTKNHEVVSFDQEIVAPVVAQNNEQEVLTSEEETAFTPSIEETQKTLTEIEEEITEIEEHDPVEDAKVAVERVTLEIDPVFSVAHDQLFVANQPTTGGVAATSASTTTNEQQHLTTDRAVSFQQIPVNKTINDAFNNTIVVGLNDRIAFEKNLFNGNSEDLNRVISQLNTFTSFQEAKDFIDDLVKPDFNNWKDKDEYEQRFMNLVAKRFL